ncbi:MAG TPA: four helix bundle protein [Roseivirga sp.]
MAFKFEDLRVWQRALDLSEEVHKLTLSFPKEEMFVLSSQIKRATDSIALNIAEGSTGQSDKEFARFLGIALRSAVEVVSCLHLGKRRGLIHDDQFQQLYDDLTDLIKMIQALRNSLN